MVDVIQSVSVHSEGNKLPTLLAPSASPLATHATPPAHEIEMKENQLASEEHPTAAPFLEVKQPTKACSEDLIGTPSQRHQTTNDITGHNVRRQSFCKVPRSRKAPCDSGTTADVVTVAPPSIVEGADRTKCCMTHKSCNNPQAHCIHEDTELQTLFSGSPQAGLSCTSPDQRDDVHCALSSEVSKKEYAGNPTSEDFSPTLGQVRRKNCLLMAVLLATTTLLAMAGGMGVGYVNKHFSTLTHHRYLEASEKLILNSSTMTLKRYHQGLRVEAHNLMSFIHSTFDPDTAKSPMALLDHLSTAFFDAWSIWMFRSTITTLHSVYIPLCNENQINAMSCLVLAVRISCDSRRTQPNCLFMVTNLENSAKLDVYRIDFSRSSRPEVGEFVMEVPLKIAYVRGERDQHYDFHSDEVAARSALHTTLVLRQQKQLGPYIVICDTGSSFDRWFDSFENGLQKTKNSYSMLFRDDGIIMAYGYDNTTSSNPHASVPCHASVGLAPMRMCGTGKSAVLDRMVGIFKKVTSKSNLVEAVIEKQKTMVMIENMDNYIVVYQDFLRFVDDYTRPHSVFFAAYAVPLEVSLSREGVFQMVICVMIIIICVFMLGSVAMVAVNQMLHVVEVISKLSTHAAMYDTEGMRSVLDQQNPGLLARLITSADVINYEFQLILANLNAYRPFLPQSLLTKGNGVFQGDSEVPPCTTCSDNSGADLSTDNVETHHEKAQALHMSNALARVVANPIENTRLLQRGFHPTKSTILVVSLSNVAQHAGNSVDLVTVFVQTALNHAVLFGGVVETIEFHKVVVSFNSHFSVPRHQEKACLCALEMREAFRDSGCIVSMGIASGYNYVGTTGTEQQKARVIVGESVVVAEALTHLSNYLGSSILATDPVVFEALVVAVAVDVMQLYYQHDNEWVLYSVSEIIGNQHAVLSSDMQLVKSVFKLVRYRQAEEALRIVRSYVAVAGERQETLSWPVRRIHALVESQQELIRRGYRRRRQQWPALEGEELIITHLNEVNRLYDTRTLPPLKGIHHLASGTAFPGSLRSGHAASSEACQVTKETSTVFGEAALARVLVDEQSKLIMALQQPTPVSNGCFSDNALFSVFMLTHSEEEDEDNNFESTTSVFVAKANDVYAGSESVSAEVLLDAQTVPLGVSNAFCASQRLQLAASYPSPSCAFSEMEYARRSSTTASSTSNAYRCCETWPLRGRSLSCLQGLITCSNVSSRSGLVKGADKRVCPLRDSNLVDNTRDAGPAVDVAAAHGGGQESSSVRIHNRFTLPQRVVSINGQVFHRTTQLLGRGSFGEVYLAMSETGALGAMKAFPLYSNNAHQLIREVETLSQMRHENIVGYDCCAVQDNFFFIICEYMAAGTLGSLIQKLGVIPEWAARKYARDVLFGIIYLHQHSWLHCDIKPENILIACDGTCKLADFGVAVLARSLTDAVSVRGTPRFSAPEAILGMWKEKADIYSFGITVAQMVMGVHPWHRYPEPDHLFVVHYAGEIRHSLQTGAPCMMQPELPMNLQDKELQSAIHRCCEFDPDLRPTAEELATLLS